MIHIDTIIIGAGPAGLQLGYFLQKGNHEYLILERNEKAGSFFSKYPHTGKLISINKKYTGRDDPEFNLRHDWNSLLCDDPTFRFTSYSDEYYPDHKDLVRYLNDFAEKYKLNIKYNTAVDKIQKENHTSKYHLTCGETYYMCNKLIIATGLSKPAMPFVHEEVSEKIKHYAEFEPGYFQKPETLEKFKNKSLAIIGSGNSAYELANHLMPYCSSIIIYSRSNKDLSMSTNYTGDLRALYLPFKESFLLKSLNAEGELNPKILSIFQESEDSKYILKQKCSNITCSYLHNIIPEISGFDKVIYCTGWSFDNSIFSFNVNVTANKKYPNISDIYESQNNQNLFFIGSLMHNKDYKKSSGGFIHGFRYLIEHFYRVLYVKEQLITNFNKNNISELRNHIIYRINNISSIYQMHGIIGDIFYLSDDSSTILYYPSICINNAYSIVKPSYNYYFLLMLEFGKDKVTDYYKLGKRIANIGTESKSTLLHPTICILNKDKNIIDFIHFDEDILANFTDKQRYSDKLDRVLQLLMTEL